MKFSKNGICEPIKGNVSVEIGLNDDFEKAVKRFSRKVRKCGILQEARDRLRFTKKSKKEHDRKMRWLFYMEKQKLEEY